MRSEKLEENKDFFRSLGICLFVCFLEREEKSLKSFEQRILALTQVLIGSFQGKSGSREAPEVPVAIIPTRDMEA